jgi:uncharacterized membrane protein
MSKWYVLFGLALTFNLLMGVSFVLANNSMWDFIITEIDYDPSQVPDSNHVMPYIIISGFEVSVGHSVYSDGVFNLGPLPTVIPNYPYMLFWVCVVGNLVLLVLALVFYEVNFGRLLKTMENRISKSRETS